MAKAINRTKEFIGFEIRRAGGREVYTAEIAQAGADERHLRIKTIHRRELSLEQTQTIEDGVRKGYSKHRIRALSGVSMAKVRRYMRENHPDYKGKRQISYFSFNERLEILESQIEIILDTIRKKNEPNNENR